MKKTKRLLVLFLALVMALSCMAIPAMAAHEDDHDCAVCSAEGIEPRVKVVKCPKCFGTMDVVKVYKDGETYYADYECPVDGSTVNRIPW